MSKWVIGKYIRLSDADRDLMKKEGKLRDTATNMLGLFWTGDISVRKTSSLWMRCTMSL